MATSGTRTFNPSLADLVLNAYGRIQLRRTQITTEHLTDAAFEANLTLAELDTLEGPNLWSESTVSTTLTSGTATYSVDASTVTILIAYIRTTVNDVNTDRVLGPMSTTDYAAQPNKGATGFPTSYWFNRASSPEITLWPVPDGTQTYTLVYRSWVSTEDAVVAGGLTVDVPRRMINAFVSDLAARLAQIWAPQKFQLMRAEADRAYAIASKQDTENVQMSITPMLSGYRR